MYYYFKQHWVFYAKLYTAYMSYYVLLHIGWLFLNAFRWLKEGKIPTKIAFRENFSSESFLFWLISSMESVAKLI